MDNIGYVRLTIWILMDKQLDKKLNIWITMDIIGYILGYIDGEIEGYQWISKRDILL
jgi:hypothetical protein